MLIFCDSFDHYLSGTEFFTKWTASRNATPNAFTTGRFGSAHNPAGERWSRKDFGTSYGTLIAGCAWKRSGAWGGNAVMGFYDSANLQCDLRINDGSGEIYVTRNGTTLGSPVSFIPGLNIWYYLELLVTFHNSTGVIIARVDGAEVINLTSQDTQQTANATANGIRIGSHTDNAPAGQIDDLYVCDNTDSGVSGVPNDDFLGDIRVEAIFPNGNGNSSALLGSDGNSTDNYLLVDETAPDEDTTYVQGSSVGDKDTYAMSALTPTAGTVYGVQMLPYARKTDAGSRSICSVTRLSGTEEDSANKTLSTSYAYLPDIREGTPAAAAWTISDVNSMEAGVKVTV